MQYLVNPPVVHKHQTKLFDGWWACAQMLTTWRAGGVKTKPAGADARAHRDRFALGRKLGAGDVMDDLKQANDLVDVTNALDLTDVDGIARLLRRHGPILIGGQYGGIPIPGLKMSCERCNDLSWVRLGTADSALANRAVAA